MADPVTSAAVETAAPHVVGYVSTQLSYIWNYQTNFQNLEEQLQNLKGRRDMVQHKVDEAIRKGDAIEQLVQQWLDKANKIIDEVTEFINKRVSMRCFKSMCPNVKNRYQRSKEALMKTEEVSKLYNEGTFSSVSYPTLPPETWLADGYENIKSRQVIFGRILDALRDRVNMIGVYGIGGCGKTTLVRAVAKQAEEDEIFDKVVFAEVSETVDIRKIQELIAERLGLDFRENSERVRADRLRDRIMQEKQILIILDNIWEDLDLWALGIPFGDNHVGCQLLLTSRDADLLNKMGSQTNFPVEILEEEEAHNLFMKIAGVGEDQRDLRSLAIQVADECGGLLVAITTVAKALRKEKKAEHWRTALRELRNPPLFNVEESVVVKQTYACINLSYQKLESEQQKLIFVLCSVMGRTHYARTEELLRYAVGLGFFEKENTIEDARDKVKILVQKLKHSSLLLDTSDSETFSIHDVVHDVGRWIASTQNKFTVINKVIPRHWTAENTLERCTSITLHDIVELPRSLECPQLKFFCMKIKTQLTKIPTEFFKRMPNLEVLHLIEMDLSPLPASIRLLKSLRTLILDECRLEDIAEIKDMEKLEILVVVWPMFTTTNIKQLPVEIGQLTSLRLLDLRDHSFVISHKTISRLSNLEELYIGYWHHQRWVEELNIGLEELKVLPLLTALDISVEAAEVLPKGLVFEKLRRYNIVIGDDTWMNDNSGDTVRTLKVKSDTNICSEDGLMKQLKGIEDLLLDGKQRVKNVLCELDGEGFPTLKHFDIRNNPYIQLIVDSMSSATCDAFPLLETLSLENLVRLEKICHDQFKTKCFCQLKTIKVDNCDKLKNLFPFSIAKHFSQLQEIEVVNCKNMEEIFIVDRADNRVIDPQFFSQLHFLTLKSLSRLRRIYSGAEVASTFQERQMPLTTNASSSEIILKDRLDVVPLFGEKVIFPNLKYLTLHDINLKRIWSNQLPTLSCCVQNLTRVDIQECSNLQYLFSSSTLGSFKQLQHLEINDCKDLEELIRIDDKCSNYVEFSSLERLKIKSCPELREFIFNVKVSFPSLQEIQIDEMENLKMIWQSQVIQSVQYCPKLCEVRFSDCQNLENVFPASVARNLLHLEELDIRSCGIKEIVAKEERVEEAAARFAFPQLTSVCLKSLEELRCFYPGTHITEYPKLNKLRVENCEKIVLLNFQKHDVEGQFDDVCAVPQPLFLVNQAFSNLEEVIINMNHIRMICQSSFLEHFFRKLKSLVIEIEYENDKSSFSWSHNLVELKLKCRFHDEIFSYEEAWKHIGMFSQLKSLHLQSLGRLKQIWKQDSKMDLIIQKFEILRVSFCDNLINLMLPSTSFKNLKILEVDDCDRLTSLIPVSTIEGLLQLEEMSITDCKEMTNIIANEGDVMEGQIIVRKLKSLKLKGLKNLRSFYSGNCTFNFPLLEKLTMNECPELKFFSSGVLITPHLQEVEQEWTNYKCEHGDLNTTLKQIHDKEVFSILEQSILEGKDLRLVRNLFSEQTKAFSNANQLNLSGDDIGMIWQSQFPGHIFPELECLHVSNDKLKCFPLEIFHRLHNVEKLELNYCSYKEIFSHEEVEKYASALAQIKCLHLCCLFSAKQMWKKDAKIDLLLWNLEILKVEQCRSLVDVLLPSSSFENLKILKVEDCSSLISLLAASTAKSLVQLEEMQISDCKMMTEVVAKEGDASRYEIIFLKLKKLELNDLSSLASFSFGNYTFKFPLLEKLNVEKCPNLKIFSSGDLSMPLLREVWQDYERYYMCQNDLNKIVQQHHEEMVFSILEQSILEGKDLRLVRNLFSEQTKAFSNANQLNLSGDDIGMIWQSQFPGHIFPELECLHVFEDESISFPLEIFHRFHNVEVLKLKNCSYEEIFSYVEVEEYARALAQIKCLHLNELDDVKQMWKKDANHDLLLRNLEILKVKWCGSLVDVLLPSSSFENLKIMKVVGCSRLISLLAASTAKSLVQLEEMQISDCKMMTEVVAKERDASRYEIIFLKLKKLELNDLSSLISFSFGNYTFMFPVLEKLDTEGCPNLNIFSSEDLSTPLLQEVCQDNIEYICKNDLNKIVQQHHEDMIFSRKELRFRMILQKFPEHLQTFSDLEQLSFSGDEIGMLWQTQLPQHLFPKLKLLEVFEDESTVFPLAILKRFYNVEQLELNCGSYEELFSCEDTEKHAGALAQTKSLSLYRLHNLKQMWKQGSSMDLILQNLESLQVNWCGISVSLMPPSSSFQNLKILKVEGCDGLVSLVAPSTAKSLVQLEELTVRKCTMMTEVILSNEEASPKEEAATKDEIIFSKLWRLDLDGLSSLTSFCSGNYTFNFPCLYDLYLNKCPKMKFFSSGVLSTPELNTISHDNTEYFCANDLNATIQGIHEKLNAKTSPDDCAGPSTLSSSSASTSAN